MKKRLIIIFLLLLCQVVAMIAPIRALFAVINNPKRAFYILLGYDLLGNVTLNGEPREYISTRAYRSRKENTRWGCILCKLLDAIEEDHCRNSAKSEGKL